VTIRALMPGVALCMVLAALAWGVGGSVPMLGVPVAALIIGLVAGPLCRRVSALQDGVSVSGKRVLSAMIVVLGLSLNVSGIVSAGPWVLGAAALVTVVAIALGSLGARALGLSQGVGLLVGFGCAVCGTAAIAAATPLVKEDDGDPGIAVAVIHALGLVMLVGVPGLATVLSLDETQTGLLIGGTLPALGHVVAAGFALSESIGDLATTVKMGRIALLLPLLAGVAMWLRKPGTWPIPWEVLGFIATAGVAAIGVLPMEVIHGADMLADALLAVAMVGIGASIDVSKLAGAAPRALALGAGILTVQVLLFLMVCALAL
jgi:uncharacterized integral membrane protein (TIGR00698 family)